MIKSGETHARETPSPAKGASGSAGWIAMVKAPDLAINKKNLIQGSMVAPWMQNSVTRLNGMVGQLAPTMAADGGLPVAGLLARVPADVREKLAKEFFLS